MVLRCGHRTSLEVGLSFQLGWQDRASPAQILTKESRLVGGEEVIEFERPVGHPAGAGVAGAVGDLRSGGRCRTRFMVNLTAAGGGHKAVD